MKKIILAASLLFSFSSFAEVFKCSFTEPFISFTYNTATQKVVESDAVSVQKRTIKNVSFQIKDSGTFLLKDKSGILLATLSLTNQGSDGMSDVVYPYEAKYMNPIVFDQAIYGGCTSSLKDIVK